MSNNDENQPLEVMPPSAIMAMEKAQIDQQIATAHQYPRSLEMFKKKALAMACLDPDTAESCIYVRPVGKEFNKATGRWEEKFAEGPSIRLAEIVAVSYCNLRAASRVVEQTERYVKCQGMAHDLEGNTAMSADVIESTVTKEGNPYSERQRALTAKVCGAKALRDAIFKVVPRALCKPIMEAAKRVAQGADQPLDVRRKKAQAWVSTLRIDEARVLAVLGVQGWSDVTSEHLLVLTGLKTAIGDGDETIDSVFPPIAKAAQVEAPGHVKGKPTTTPPTTPPKTAPSETKPETKPETKASEPPAPAKTPQDAPKEAEAPKSPPAPETPASAQTAANAPAQSEASPFTEAPAEVPSGTNAVTGSPEDPQQAQPPAAPAKPEPPKEPDPYFSPREGDTDGIASIKLLAQKSGVTWFQLQSWLRKSKLMKENQKDLGELAAGKIDALCRNWDRKLPEIRTLPWK